MQTKRLFIGIKLSSLLAKRLIREMGAFANWPIIPTRKENLHVTVLFLGFVAEENLAEILPAIERAIEGIHPFELRFHQLGYFPNNEHPTALFVFGEESEELLRLRKNLDQELGYLVPEKKSFRPHITLGKIRRGKFEALPEKPNFDKSVNFVEPVSSLALFESTTEDGKRIYLPIEEFPLGE